MKVNSFFDNLIFFNRNRFINEILLVGFHGILLPLLFSWSFGAIGNGNAVLNGIPNKFKLIFQFQSYYLLCLIFTMLLWHSLI